MMRNFIRQILGRFRPFNGVNTPLVLQFSETECGMAALAMIFAYYKTPISLESLREKCGSSRDGCKASTLVKVATACGFTAEAYTVDLDEIKNLTEPVIAFWNFSHYVVIKGIGSQHVFINDPAYGQLKINFEVFDKSFTGVIITMRPREKVLKIEENSSQKSFAKELLSHFKLGFIFILISLLVLATYPLLNSAVTSLLINYCLLAHNTNWLPYLALVSILLLGLASTARVLQKWTQFKIGAQASLIKCSQLISHMLRLPLAFYSLRSKSEIIAVSAQVEVVVNLLFKSLTTLVINSLSSLICLLALMKMDLYLAAISFGLAASSLLTFYLFSKLNLPYEQAHLNLFGKWYAYTLASLKNREGIQACGLENAVFAKWQALFSRKIEAQDKIKTLASLMEALNKAFHSVSLLIILFLGKAKVVSGFISIGKLMAYYALHLHFCAGLGVIFHAFQDLQNAYTSQLRLNDLLAQDKELRFKQTCKEGMAIDKAAKKENFSDVIDCHVAKNAPRNDDFSQKTICTTTPAQGLICKQVSFYYNKTTAPVLNEINIEILPGQRLALVGSSGSGKSTLAKILSALYQPHSGEITYDGKNLAHLNSAELARLFAYVSQEAGLFSGTIYENLTWWRKDVPAAMLEQAIKDACLEELISLRGLYGKVEGNGSNFSGGEKQRIELARALIQNTPVLILDEATAALDLETEARLLKNLEKHAKTIIYVAHRLSTIQACDQILVLDKGKLVEQGRHQELIKAQGCYYRLIQHEQEAGRS